MADLGNLKILLDMATTGTLKSTLERVDHKLDEMREKASNLQLGFDDKSISSISTKMRDIVGSFQEVSKTAGTKLAEGMKQSAEATKNATSQMQQQVALSADLEALFKEMAGTLRSIAEAQEKISSAEAKSNSRTKEQKKEKQKLYDITRLRQMAEEKNGKLAKDEVAVLGRMEALKKRLVGLSQEYGTELTKDLIAEMEIGGVSMQQLKTLETQVTRMEAVAKAARQAAEEEQKASRQQEQTARKQKQNAKEREATAKRQAQLETSIIRIETKLLGINELRLSEEAKLLVAKMRSGQITQEEVNRLNAVLSKEQAILSAENKKGEAVEATNMRFGRQSSLLRQINSYLATYVSVIGAVNLIRNLVRITGEFEAQHVALRSILQDVAGADRIFYQLQELAVKSPFTFRNLTDYAKQLSAFSVPMNEIYDTTKRLADVSAGLGVDMSRIILAYGQIRSASFLRGQEVRQLTEAGIPVLQELAKQFKEIEGEAISVGKVFDKISARQVPFEMIEKMFKDLTSEGGKFYEMQEVLAETVKGKVSNLQDAWEIMLSKVGESNDGFIKGAIDGVTKLIKNYKELAKAIELAAVAYGTYRVVCVAATQAEATQRLVHIATGKSIMKLPALLSRLTIGLRGIPRAIASIISKLNPWAVAIAAVTTATTYLIMRHKELTKHIRETDKAVSKAIATADASKSSIHYYIERMKEAKEGTREYEEARKAVIEQSGAYISATDAERLSLENVDQVWVNICKHIEEATRLQAMQSITAEAAASKQEAQLNAMTELGVYQQSNGLSNETRKDIAAYIRGEIDKETLRARLIAAGVPNPTYSYRGAEYDIYSKGSLAEVLSKAEAWQLDYERAERIYEETLMRAQEGMKDLYGGKMGPDKGAGGNVLDGWRKRASDYLKTVTGSTYGVSITDETNLASLAKQGAEQLDDLRKSLDLIPKTETEDYKNVENAIKFWERLSEAIYGPGNTEFNNSTKKTKKDLKDAESLRKEQIAAIKQAVQDLKEAKRWYDQLVPLLGARNAQALMASFNFSVPKEGFNKAFQNYSDQIAALGDENGARDVMNWANGREVGDVLDSAKAIEKYTEALKGLEAQTKRLNLTGFAQELDKIIVDTDSKNRQLETNWAQKAKELEKAKGGWIQRYQIENPTKDAEAAWAEFYKKQTDMAKEAMDTQREYNRKVAQEQINYKASKWLEEMMKENNINLYDMGDKSLEQVNILIERLKKLSSDETLANLIPDELKSDAAIINVEFSELLSTIKKIANTRIGDLSVEKMKKTLSGVKAIASKLGLNVDLNAVESSYATLAQAITEVANAQEEVNAAQKEYEDIKDSDDMDAKATAYRNLAVAKGILEKKTRDMAEAQAQYNTAVSMAGLGAFASALGKVATRMKELAKATGDKSLEEFGDIASGVSQNLNAAAEGYAMAAQAGLGAYSWVGAIIGGVADAIGQVYDYVDRVDEFDYKMGRANSLWAFSVQQVRNEYALLQEQLDTMFGSASMSKMSGWADVIREQGEILRNFNSGEDYYNFLMDFVNGNVNAHELYNALRFESYKNAQTLAGKEFKTWDYNWFEEFFRGEKDKYQTLAELAPELFKEDGSINFDYLDEFKKSAWYEQLSDGWKQTLDEMAEANKTFEAACKEMKDYLTSIFGDMGASISNSLISAFEATGEVAIDTGEILSSVAKKFVDDWTQSFLTTKYLSSLSDSINDIWMDSSIGMEEQVAQSLGLVRDSLYSMQESLPYIQQFYEGLEDQFHWADGAGEEIGDAIKTAMVEQNSSLIAGYINSMRADLSMQRNEIMRNISPAVTSISTGFDTHLRYMESVAGNVSNIWDRLNLLTTNGSGVKINTRM